MKNDQMQRGTDGSGSAEQTGSSRNEQHISEQGKQEIGNAIGEDSSRIANPSEMGANSGREDASGGSGDRMENEDSGKETER